MLKFLLTPFGIIASITAQILLKKAGTYTLKEYSFYLHFFLAGLSYAGSFILYTIILKIFPISKISPIMTMGTMIGVIFAGIIIFSEIVSIKQIIGIILGIIAIGLIAW
jgi:uncharacterized membrane protein